jgi:hypothetical protein
VENSAEPVADELSTLTFRVVPDGAESKGAEPEGTELMELLPDPIESPPKPPPVPPPPPFEEVRLVSCSYRIKCWDVVSNYL